MYMQPGQEAGMNIQRSVFMQHISQINLLFIFVVPALTMRLLAEVKKTRTYDLLLTAPISATDIALGKHEFRMPAQCNPIISHHSDSAYY